MHRLLAGGAQTSASTTPLSLTRTIRFAVALSLVAAALMALTAGRAAAATNGVCGALSVTNPAGSVGTAGDPCLISSDADLDTALSQINADTAHTGASTADYQLTTDLDYSKDSSNTTGASTANWAGIDWFSGTFDGGGHTISNLTYTATTDGFTATLPNSVGAALGDVGFFRILNGATVKNLTLQNVHASGIATSLVAGGVAVASFATTITGVTLLNPAFALTASGGAGYAGGMAGISYANSYADDTAGVSDGGVSTFTNDAVSGGSLSADNRVGGIAGLTRGETTISDDYVNTAIKNAAHPPDGNASGDYSQGGLVGWPDGTYGASTGTAMSNNVIAGSMTFQLGTTGTAGAQSSGGINWTSPTIGYSTSSSSSTTWTSTNNLVSSTFTFTNATGTGLAGADGVSVSPQTLATQSTFSGAATGLTDASTSATYNDLGWNFGSGGVWVWTGSSTSGTAALAETPNVSLGQSSITAQVNSSESAAALANSAGATVAFANTALNSSDVTWSINGTITWATPGTYSVNLVASIAGFSDSVPLTVVVSATVALTSNTDTLEATTTAPSTTTLLSALGASLPTGDTGPMSIDLTGADGGDDAVSFNEPGSYTITVYDTNASEDVTPATATIVIVPVPVVTVTTSTLYFNSSAPPTTAEIESAAGAAVTDGDGNALTGATLSATVSSAALAGTAGTYTATLTGTDTAGFTSAGVSVTVVVSAASLTVSDTTPVLQLTSTAPSAAAVLTDLGATLTGSAGGTASVDLTGSDSGDDAVKFSQPGEYTVTVSDTDANDGVGPVIATIEIVPVSVLTVPNQTVYFNTAAPLTAAAVLTASGAELTDGDGNVVFGPVSANVPQGCGTTPGTCTATISGTDAYGFAATPVTVTIDISAASVQVANGTATFASGSTPSQAALAGALGATVSNSTTGGTPAVDTFAVDWGVPGTYTVIVGDSSSNDAAATVTAQIRIVPAPIVTLPTPTIYLPASASDPLVAATLIANSGATLTDASGNPIAGSLAADTSGVDGSVAGTYSATITGTDAYGLSSAPAIVSVVIYVAGQQPGAVSVTGTPAVGATLTANLAGWADLAAPTYQWLLNGVPIAGATSSTFVVPSADAGDNISVTVSEAPSWYQAASVTSSVVTIAGSSGPGTNQTGGGGTTTTAAVVSTPTNPGGTNTTSTNTGSSQTKKTTTFTPSVDALKTGVSSTTVLLKLPASIKKGTKLVVTESEPGKKAKTKSAKVTKAGQVRFATGKLPAGTTVIRFYKTVTSQKTVDGKTKPVTTKKLVKTETVKVKAKANAKKQPKLVMA